MPARRTSEGPRRRRRALELDPGSAEAHAARGFAFSISRRFDEARAELAAAVDLSPALYEAHYLFGRVCWAEGRLEEAALHFEDAAAVQPDDYQAVGMLATVHDGLEQPDRAVAAYRRAAENTRRHLELYPGDVRALYLGAIALRRLGEDAEAREWADRALAAGADDPAVYYNLGCFYALGGDPDRAFGCLDEAIDRGFAHREWLEHDPDLSVLRRDPRHPALLSRLDRK